jgi:uncharacterized integral membrane protein
MSGDVQKRGHYPQDQALKSQIAGRHRMGFFWQAIFVGATVLAIVVLTVLLINVIN